MKPQTDGNPALIAELAETLVVVEGLHASLDGLYTRLFEGNVPVAQNQAKEVYHIDRPVHQVASDLLRRAAECCNIANEIGRRLVG